MEPLIKSYTSFEPINTEHDHGLILCRRIGKGLGEHIEIKRIKAYTDWFRRNYLDLHFKVEEEHIFPLLGNQNFRVKKALANHRRLRRLFDETSQVERALNRIEEELGRYIRYEEGTLYHELQSVAGPEQFAEIEKYHQGVEFPPVEWDDKFWLS